MLEEEASPLLKVDNKNEPNEMEFDAEEEDDENQGRVGTPFYLAPELWEKPMKYGKKSDIWSLGVILYEMCCLEYPFPATKMDELKEKVLNDPVKKHPVEVNREFAKFFIRMLEKDPVKRPSIE